MKQEEKLTAEELKEREDENPAVFFQGCCSLQS